MGQGEGLSTWEIVAKRVNEKVGLGVGVPWSWGKRLGTLKMEVRVAMVW